MTREQMIDAAVRAALAGRMQGLAPFELWGATSEASIGIRGDFYYAALREFERIASNADHASRDGINERIQAAE